MSIHYGSLEIAERQRLTDTLSELSTRAPTIVNVAQQQSQAVIEYADRNQIDKEAEHKAQISNELRKLMVPTTEADVKSQLRQMGQPATYFGESAADRRNRLKQLLIEHLQQFGKLPQFSTGKKYTSNLENEYFLYEGLDELRSARVQIAKSSLKKAGLRVERQRLRRLQIDALMEDQEVKEALLKVKDFEISMAEFADSSSISRSALSLDQSIIGTAGGSGECKLWDSKTLQLKATLRGHLAKAHTIAFHNRLVGTGSADMTIRLWEGENNSAILKGHEDRVNQVLFHDNHLISASYDKTWRLWDLETQQELLVQTGHSKPVYCIALHPDGSLLYSGDLGGTGMIWDLRTGKSILPLQGHVKAVLCADFSDNGYHLATGGDDNNIKIWDIRRRSHIEKIPAHLKLISSLQFHDSKYLHSASYDGTIKFWNARDWSLYQTYTMQNTKITSALLTSDTQKLITTSLDRKLTLWEHVM